MIEYNLLNYLLLTATWLGSCALEFASGYQSRTDT